LHSAIICDTRKLEKTRIFVSQEKKLGRGRPKVPEAEARGIFISTRLSPEENKAISEAIKRSGKTKSEWMREALINAALNK